jgi:hypothetical protein
VISHRLPHMVAGMVVGGGHNGAIGGVGMMTLFAGALTSSSLAGRLSGSPAAALAMGGVGAGAKMLQDRIAAAEAAMGTQKVSRVFRPIPAARPMGRVPAGWPPVVQTRRAPQSRGVGTGGGMACGKAGQRIEVDC